ncbi:hypothetical protein EDB87DRAFT_1635196, partial [Lactarius vividus]
SVFGEISHLFLFLVSIGVSSHDSLASRSYHDCCRCPMPLNLASYRHTLCRSFFTSPDRITDTARVPLAEIVPRPNLFCFASTCPPHRVSTYASYCILTLLIGTNPFVSKILDRRHSV